MIDIVRVDLLAPPYVLVSEQDATAAEPYRPFRIEVAAGYNPARVEGTATLAARIEAVPVLAARIEPSEAARPARIERTEYRPGRI